jgi:hypothetical protein
MFLLYIFIKMDQNKVNINYMSSCNLISANNSLHAGIPQKFHCLVAEFRTATEISVCDPFQTRAKSENSIKTVSKKRFEVQITERECKLTCPCTLFPESELPGAVYFLPIQRGL